MTFLYQRDINKRNQTSILGTNRRVEYNDITSLDDISKEMIQRMKFGYFVPDYDESSNILFKKTLDDIRTRVRASQRFDEAPLAKKLIDLYSSNKGMTDKQIEQEILSKTANPQGTSSAKATSSMHNAPSSESSYRSDRNPNILETYGSKSQPSKTTEPVSEMEGAGKKKMKDPQNGLGFIKGHNVKSIIEKIKKSNNTKQKKGGGLIEL